MSKLMNYRVVREHVGDKPYAEGDTRTGRESDLGHLVPKLLEPIGEAKEPVDTTANDEGGEKAAPAHANKAAPKPQNKAAPGKTKAE
jgi:hypothetical protein